MHMYLLISLVFSGVGKEIRKAANQPDCEDLALWRQSVTNHLYWAAASTAAGNGDTIVAKWESILFHMMDQHNDHPNPLFPECAHGELQPENRGKQWLEQSRCIQ